MDYNFLPRTLWYPAGDKITELSQAELHLRTEPLVILGEAGMGKTTLLQSLAKEHGYAYCTARQLTLRADPQSLINTSVVLVIDALDEVASQRPGDTVERVLKSLGKLSYPRFILSCRVADWRSATGSAAISEQYDQTPLQLHLRPFTDKEVQDFLQNRLGNESAEIVTQHFYSLGLQNWLGNPQTLELVVSTITSGLLPRTRTDLFELAVQQLAGEHKDTKAGAQLPLATALAAAGAACAALILSGSDSITRKAALNANEGELTLAELSLLPDGQHIEQVLGTRLFRAINPDCFGYCHRSIGEHLGAKWLAAQADSPRKRRRLLALFNKQGLVPASLRGIYAWLAQDPKLTTAVITADPMSLIEYGDSDQLTVEQGRDFLQALKQVAIQNPKFRDWRKMAARGIAQPGLTEELRRLIQQPDQPYGLRLLILESIQGSAVAGNLRQELISLVTTSTEPYGLRRASVESLTDLLTPQDSTTIARTLEDHANPDCLRLALKLIDHIGYMLFDDAIIVRIACAYAIKDDHMVGKYYTLERRLPSVRLASFLDSLAQTIPSLELGDHSEGKSELTELAFYLITRCMKEEQVEASQLRRWLEPFHEQDVYQSELRKQIYDYLCSNDALRRSVQKLVLLDEQNSQSPSQRYYGLLRCSSGFTCSSADAMTLLEALDPHDSNDDRWEHIVQLAPHNDERGTAIHQAARVFAASYPERLQWLEQLDMPQPLTEWELKSAKRKREHLKKENDDLAKAHQWYFEHIGQLRLGSFNVVLKPAMAYLGRFRNVDKKLPAHERIAQWLGPEFSQPAHEGFEAYLQQNPPNPSAIQIAEIHAEKKYYNARYIIIAAMAERVRQDIGFNNLPDDRVMAGFFILHHSRFNENAETDVLRQKLETELKKRHLWQQAIQQFYEPQLRANCQYVTGLHELLYSEEDEKLAVELASKWLQQFPDLRYETETQLINRLLRSGQYATLKELMAKRLGTMPDDRRLDWSAVELIIDFESAVTRLTPKIIEKSMLWHLRDHSLGVRYAVHTPVLSLSPSQLEWIIAKFRAVWPVVEHPTDVCVGDKSSWDACQYLSTLINLLASDVTPEAVDAMTNLRDAPVDSYTEQLLAVSTEQKRIRFETVYAPPSLTEITAITHDLNPISLADLQAWMLEELNVVQNKVHSDDAESWRGFHNDSELPLAEEHCRDHLLGLLRQGASGISFNPETHVANDKKVDITCSVGTLRLPIEIKGQWHKDVWTAADQQLDPLYVTDWRAAGRGIYLVLWFGRQANPKKDIKSPGRGICRPASPEKMIEMLMVRNKAIREGRIKVVVLDLCRPISSQKS